MAAKAPAPKNGAKGGKVKLPVRQDLGIGDHHGHRPAAQAPASPAQSQAAKGRPAAAPQPRNAAATPKRRNGSAVARKGSKS